MRCSGYQSSCFARHSRLAPEDTRVAAGTTVMSSGEGFPVAPFEKKLLNASILGPVDSTCEVGREGRDRNDA